MKLLRHIFLAAALLLACGSAYAQKPDIVEVIEVRGVINDSTAEDITRQVEKIADNAKVKAVLLQLDTPGGGVLASAVIYEELAKLKVPVVVWCQNLCASGGMYIAMAPTVKHVAIRTETIAGSVGVIMTVTRFNRLLDFLKVDNTTYKSGKLKDAGNATRPSTPEDEAYLQSMIDTMAGKFFALVAKSRGAKISPASWAEIKTAKIFVGEEAVKVGLVDAVMTKEQVLAKTKELSGSKNIFTRDELKKMSTQANESASYQTPGKLPSMFGDLPFLVDTVKEIRAGEVVKFEYRMPYTF